MGRRGADGRILPGHGATVNPKTYSMSWTGMTDVQHVVGWGALR